ncbi:hypothetical protein ACJ41O_007914 [Fusarium nematophilum]
MPVLPSSTVPSEPHLVARQDDPSRTSFVAVPSTYGAANNSPHPGVVAGIVLGSVAGFLLLLYIVYAILHRGPVIIPVETSSTTGGAPPPPMSSVTGDSASRSVLSFRSRRERRHRRPRSSEAASKRTRSRATTVRSRERSRRRVSPVIVDPPRPEPFIVDPPSPLSPSPLSSVPPPRVVPGSTVSGLSSDNEIVVEEEHSRSPPRRPYGQRYSQERYRRETIYRDGPDYGPRDYSPRRESRRYSRDR